MAKKWKIGEKRNVLLIQGISETFVYLKTIGNALNNDGYRINFLTSYSPNDKIENIAEKIVEFIKNKNLQNLNIITHSKGGLVARYISQNYRDIDQRIKTIFTIATPHHGSLFAHLVKSQKQMLPNSEFLKNLNSTSSNSKIINIYPRIDNHVIPNSSLILKGAKNIKLDIIGHTRILEDKKTMEEIKKYL